MTERRTPLTARGIGGDYPTNLLPGRLIDEQPDTAKRAASQAEKLRVAQEAEGDSNGG